MGTRVLCGFPSSEGIARTLASGRHHFALGASFPTANPRYFKRLAKSRRRSAPNVHLSKSCAKCAFHQILVQSRFSSNDAVGHALGPNSPEVRDISIKTDRVLAKLFACLDERVGMRNVLVVLTSDHGVAPLPEDLARWKMPGGRMSSADLFGPIKSALEAKFGKGEWIVGTAGTTLYLNLDLVRQKELDAAEVRRVAATAAAAVPHVERVYTRDQLQRGEVPNDPISNRVARSFNEERSGDLEILLEPYWIRSSSGTTHGTPYSYDTHIPLIFMGSWIKPGHYPENVALNDLAPALATILGIETPSGSVGKVLNEIIQGGVANEAAKRTRLGGKPLVGR